MSCTYSLDGSLLGRCSNEAEYFLLTTEGVRHCLNCAEVAQRRKSMDWASALKDGSAIKGYDNYRLWKLKQHL